MSRFIRWFMKDRFSFYDVYVIMLVTDLMRSESLWYILLFIPFAFIRGFICAWGRDGKQE